MWSPSVLLPVCCYFLVFVGRSSFLFLTLVIIFFFVIPPSLPPSGCPTLLWFSPWMELIMCVSLLPPPFLGLIYLVCSFCAAYGAPGAVRDSGGTQDDLHVDWILPHRGDEEPGPRVDRLFGETARLLLPAQQARPGGGWERGTGGWGVGTDLQYL